MGDVNRTYVFESSTGTTGGVSCDTINFDIDATTALVISLILISFVLISTDYTHPTPLVKRISRPVAHLTTSAIIFNIIKWIGVIYLIFIGLRLIIESAKTVINNDIEYKSKGGKRRSRLFIDGFFIAVSNPKGILFFTALFPQFINVNDTSRNGFMIIFITLGIVAFGCYMLYAIFGVRLNKLFHLRLF